jgi:hypothetical protein
MKSIKNKLIILRITCGIFLFLLNSFETSSQSSTKCNQLADSVITSFFEQKFENRKTYLQRDSLYYFLSSDFPNRVIKVNNFPPKIPTNTYLIKFSSHLIVENEENLLTYEVVKKRKKKVYSLEGYFKFKIKCTDKFIKISLMNGIEPICLYYKEK